ncbi:MAG: hypothetical protein KAG84_07500 [Bacteroidales bacterium]|nr:hypothetical protein [Bacteroidales bacterium]
MKLKTSLIIISVFVSSILFANTDIKNQNISKHKPKISFREVIWGVTHPFIALKVKRLTHKALIATDSLGKHNILKDKSGGRLDAYKHSFWMALLSQNIKEKKARRIGIIHEKVNYNSYKRHGSCQDSSASAMDLLNNEIGIVIGTNNKNISENNLSELIIESIDNGKMYILKKDTKGNFLDCSNKIIDLNKEKGWDKRKCVISS